MTTKGFTNVVMAEKMGITKQAFGKMINAESLTTATLEKIALALDVPIWQLFVSPDDVADAPSTSANEVCAFVRCDGVHRTADNWAEWWSLVDELGALHPRQ